MPLKTYLLETKESVWILCIGFIGLYRHYIRVEGLSFDSKMVERLFKHYLMHVDGLSLSQMEIIFLVRPMSVPRG
jgi:hypothetical protein